MTTKSNDIDVMIFLMEDLLKPLIVLKLPLVKHLIQSLLIYFEDQDMVKI